MKVYHLVKVNERNVGAHFGSWKQEGASFRVGKHWRAVASCGGCGRCVVVRCDHLKSGRSTGCLGCASKTHGMHGSPEYHVWEAMTQRCHNRNFHQYCDYGGRGISVCDDWRGEGGFSRFYKHIGPRPSSKHSIDRIDNDRDYEPGNVRWATVSEQHRNRRDNVMLTIRGKTMCLADWLEHPGSASHSGVTKRLSKGWSHEHAVFGKG